VKIMVFLHGTVIMHSTAAGVPRQERVRQVMRGEPAVQDFTSYIPVENAMSKLQVWHSSGAEIVYLSSHCDPADVSKDREVLERYGFPAGPIYFRHGSESYADVAAGVRPDILVEDDCESIGGEAEMTAPHLPAELRRRIISIVVPEFGGIDDLPDDIRALANPPGPR
jgi:hypothetical protein